MRKIGVLTSGGDAPGMNAAIRSVVRSACAAGVEVVGIERGYVGLLRGWLRPMQPSSVGGIINRGGTILRTARSEEFKTPEGQSQAAETVTREGIEGLAIIGGDGQARGKMSNIIVVAEGAAKGEDIAATFT